jgi:ribonuclease HI
MKQSRDHFIVYSDGACSGNPGPGGWGSIVLSPLNHVVELGDHDPSTTNNRMEMMAAIGALRMIEAQKNSVHFYTDSTYLIRGITQWIWGWKKNSWKTGEGQEVSNRDLWEELHSLVQARGAVGKIQWLYSRGHIGIPGNERCDRIAVAFSKRERVSLYEGDLESYNVDILRLPQNTDLPEMKNSYEKKVAYSYLSLLGGTVYRHKDWPSCQRRVNGQSGAKFKKATSAQEEHEILKAWGLSSQTSIRED